LVAEKDAQDDAEAASGGKLGTAQETPAAA